LVGNREGKRPLERPSRGRNDGIKMDLEEIGWGRELDWSDLPLDRRQVAGFCERG
jgi:hypothetical protein